MQWQSATLDSHQHFQIPDQWLYIHYYDALNILFRFENSVRVFVYSILKNKFFDEWHQQTFDSHSGQKSISNLAATRIKHSENFGYLGYDVKCPIMFLTSGELVELIISDAYWELFKIHFRGNKNIIKNKLLEIGDIRNSLAHFRPIKADDVELIKQNSKHTLIGVEEYLKGLFRQPNRVPTNTASSWYKELSTIGNDSISTTLWQSNDEEWINLRLQFQSIIIDKSLYLPDYRNYKVTRIISPNILSIYPNFTKFLTCATERLSYPRTLDNNDVILSKVINFVFRSDIIKKHYSELTSELKDMISLVTKETSLLTDDNLARGQLIDSAGIRTHRRKSDGNKSQWIYEYSDIKCPYESTHSFEYWGDLDFWSDDIISSAPRYPWMPSDISNDDIPF